MSLRIETPEETLRRLQSHENAVVRPAAKGTAELPPEQRRVGWSRGGSRSTVRLVITALLGIAALVFGGAAAGGAVEMAIYGEEVTAEILRVEPTGEGGNRMYVEFPVDGVAHQATMDERGNVPQPGESMDVIYDTRDVDQVTEAPPALAYWLIAGLIVLGGYWIISAVRGFRQRRRTQWLP